MRIRSEPKPRGKYCERTTATTMMTTMNNKRFFFLHIISGGFIENPFLYER